MSSTGTTAVVITSLIISSRRNAYTEVGFGHLSQHSFHVTSNSSTDRRRRRECFITEHASEPVLVAMVFKGHDQNWCWQQVKSIIIICPCAGPWCGSRRYDQLCRRTAASRGDAFSKTSAAFAGKVVKMVRSRAHKICPKDNARCTIRGVHTTMSKFNSRFRTNSSVLSWSLLWCWQGVLQGLMETWEYMQKMFSSNKKKSKNDSRKPLKQHPWSLKTIA